MSPTMSSLPTSQRPSSTGDAARQIECREVGVQKGRHRRDAAVRRWSVRPVRRGCRRSPSRPTGTSRKRPGRSRWSAGNASGSSSGPSSRKVLISSLPRNHCGSGGIENCASSASRATIASTSPFCQAIIHRATISSTALSPSSRKTLCWDGAAEWMALRARCRALFTEAVGGLELRRDFSGRVAEDFAQDQHGPLRRGQMLHSSDKGQLDALPGQIVGLRSWARDMAQAN